MSSLGPTDTEPDQRIDPHVKVLNERVVARAKARGLSGLVYAPHFTRLPDIRARAAAFADETLAILPGREIFTGSWRDRKHVLAVGLTDPVPDFITLEGAMAEFDDQGATVLVPHPGFMTVSLNAADIARYRSQIDGVEIYNPKHTRWHNRRAQDLAATYDLLGFASSYAHLEGSVGEVWTDVPGPIEGSDDVLAALDRSATRQTGHRSGVAHRLRCAAEATHLAWENSYEKLDRVVLSGREPTHPGDPAYEGRFADVAVY